MADDQCVSALGTLQPSRRAALEALRQGCSVAEANQRARGVGGHAVLGRVAGTPDLPVHGGHPPPGETSTRAQRSIGFTDKQNSNPDLHAAALDRSPAAPAVRSQLRTIKPSHPQSVQVRQRTHLHTQLRGSSFLYSGGVHYPSDGLSHVHVALRTHTGTSSLRSVANLHLVRSGVPVSLSPRPSSLERSVPLAPRRSTRPRPRTAPQTRDSSPET